jgi:hypothetical protein
MCKLHRRAQGCAWGVEPRVSHSRLRAARAVEFGAFFMIAIADTSKAFGIANDA